MSRNESTTEKALEDVIEACLLNEHKYISLPSDQYDAENALFPQEVISFIKETQGRLWQALEKHHGPRSENILLADLVKAIEAGGCLDVLRHGFKSYGRTFKMAYFAPAHGMTPELEELYTKNRLGLTRQLYYSSRNRNSLDLVISLNGLPVATAELKNHFTGQNVHNAMRQYRENRDPNEKLFEFKKRALVHFAVDPDLVYMTTHLKKDSTYFLPFNKGNEEAAGNPPAPRDNNTGKHRTHYLWEEIWQKDSLLDIMGRFLHLEVVEKKFNIQKGGKTVVQKTRKEALVFPRYHQLNVVRRLVADARQKGPGHNYLIQHSAGSGKSNSIAWLAHRLSSLHNDKDEKIFHSVIVITDRIVLDRQLQDTIYQFEHKQGVVVKIDENSKQLADALDNGTPIVITTIQKFPFAAEKMENAKSRNYAVIVDEAHSSQTGETAADLRSVLSAREIEETIAQRAEEEDLSDLDEAILRAAARRSRQPNLSYFAFTATPKHKTLEIFNEPGENGKSPFDLYSMRQAIEEKFILDVLAHYTTYKTYYGLIKKVEDDPNVPKKKAAKALARFISLHPHNIAQKTEVMIEHFRTHTMHKIGGRAKAMVVTSSRLHAVRYKEAFDKYIGEKGYKEIKTLVAFSGKVADPDLPGKEYTEPGMNHVRESELRDKFATDEYQVLIVAEKYQTGFDQPLLHTMYVDKRLAGIQAVQTLSRLNRTHAGKEDTFVLDFYNEEADIYESFKPYYRRTEAGEHADISRLAELQQEMDAYHILYKSEIDAFCAVYFRPGEKLSNANHGRMESILQAPVDRFNELEEETREEYRSKLKSFLSIYSFLSQIVPFQDADYEKYYTVIRHFIAKLPYRITDPLGVDIYNDVKLKFYRIDKVCEGRIDLEPGTAEPLKGPKDVGGGVADDEKIKLSELVEMLNEKFGMNFGKADEILFDQFAQSAKEDESIRQAATANTIDNFKYVFDKILENLIIDRMEGNENIVSRFLNDENFRKIATYHLMNKVYHEIRAEEKAG